MKLELQNTLYQKYPKIFRQKDLDATQTGMCWGIECGDGWYSLLDSLCSKLQGMTDNNTHIPERFPQIEATQVKEKYGTLSFYTRCASDYQDGVIDFAEYISGTVCDICGNPGKTQGKGWISTRCEAHVS